MGLPPDPPTIDDRLNVLLERVGQLFEAASELENLAYTLQHNVHNCLLQLMKDRGDV